MRLTLRRKRAELNSCLRKRASLKVRWALIGVIAAVIALITTGALLFYSRVEKEKVLAAEQRRVADQKAKYLAQLKVAEAEVNPVIQSVGSSDYAFLQADDRARKAFDALEPLAYTDTQSKGISDMRDAIDVLASATERGTCPPPLSNLVLQFGAGIPMMH
jgi:hypothetical protein